MALKAATLSMALVTADIDSDTVARLAAAVVIFVIWAAFTAGMLFVIHFVLTLPLRRAERARIFLDLVDTALGRGQPVEEALVSVSESRDRTLGKRFQLVAAQLRSGMRMGDALAAVPHFLPHQITTMLKAGERLGDLRKVLPACRQLLPDALSHVRSAMNYLIILALTVLPMASVVMIWTAIFVLPKFKEIAADMMEGSQLPPWTRLVFGMQPSIVGLQLGVLFLLVLAVFFYAAGPRVTPWLRSDSFPVMDWLAWRLPWQRKRLQRDFSAMLAVLLDAEVAEPEAVALASQCTCNAIFIRRARRAVERLRQGRKLTEALEVMDDSGEFQWRLTNSCHAHGGFMAALAGWHEALDAKAFQQEQAAAHLITTTLVLLNGFIVGSVVVAVFLILVSIINAGLLW